MGGTVTLPYKRMRKKNQECTHKEKASVSEPRREASGETNFAIVLFLDL